ncbi:MAG: thiamine phosphate synthase [Kiritimatiellae bacterium]|jgi:thiamine-phosphate pyrophosphorylase|nr:thiamine phosphate synthase [Kiritimatiellia bacterium]
MTIERFGLYLIITNPATSYEACAEAAVKAKIRYIQLRMKKTIDDDVLERARNLRSITQGTSTRFIINDDPQLATEMEADGVHLGQEDMPIAQARIKFSELQIFGLSTHSEEQASNAVDICPDYCGVGPVYKTPTKDISDPELGAKLAGRIIQHAPFTTVAIGGINENNLDMVLKNGAINYAVVRYVCQAAKPYDAIVRLQDIWTAAQN